MPFVANAVSWSTTGIVCAGQSNQVQFISPTDGRIISQIDHSQYEMLKDFNCAAIHPSGETAVLGNFNWCVLDLTFWNVGMS